MDSAKLQAENEQLRKDVGKSSEAYRRLNIAHLRLLSQNAHLKEAVLLLAKAYEELAAAMNATDA